MSEFNILFTSAGRRVALLQAFRNALDALGVQGRLVAADVKRDAPAMFVADVAETVPNVGDPGYMAAIAELCERHAIRLVVPLIDTELHLLSPHRAAFAKRGVTLLVSSCATNAICRDKRNTAAFFRHIGVDTPSMYDPAALLANPAAPYPFIVKPSDGSCSVGVNVVNGPEALDFHCRHTANALVQEWVRGDEYTVDVLVDFQGRVRCVVPRLRIETRAGEVSKGMTCRNPALIEAVRHVVSALPGAVGCITVQCFLSEGRFRFIEINPRFGGGVPLTIEAGADFPRWILEWLLGREPVIREDDWRDRRVMLRYEAAVFLQEDQIRCPEPSSSISTTPCTPSASSS